MSKRLLSTFRTLQHENPLGLPTSNAPPTLPRRQRGLPEKRRLANVKKTIAISSAKGGVGKSTVAANLALAFTSLGHRTGILDADIFGPSIPTLFDLRGEPRLSSNNQLLPLINYGVKSMSMGYLVGEDAPVVWRGLMVMKALQQLLHEVDWSAGGGLDILVLDLPPGTGDTQLTITQQIQLDGAVVVSTPQDIALNDAVRGIAMFQKVNVEVLGMVQNMSVFKCPGCGLDSHIFGSHGVERKCKERGIDLLGDIPLEERICADADAGKPTIVAQPGSASANAYINIAARIAEKISLVNS